MGAWERLPREDQLERLRALRARCLRSPSSLSDALARESATLKRLEKRLAGAGDVWLALCPSKLARKTTIIGLNRSVLTIRAADAPARYELDRWLRSGGEQALITASAAPIRTVRVIA